LSGQVLLFHACIEKNDELGCEEQRAPPLGADSGESRLAPRQGGSGGALQKLSALRNRSTLSTT
jgi:hypothetical protein